MFAALVLVGFIVWFAASPNVTFILTGVYPPRLPGSDPPLSFFRTAIVCGALALLGGAAFPRGFYLWGAALALHGPLAQGLTVYLGYREGVDMLVGGARGIAGYVVLSAMLFVLAIFCYTVLSALGAGARYLLGRWARRR